MWLVVTAGVQHQLAEQLPILGEHAHVESAARHEDCSPELHRSVTMRLFELGGLDRELAEALYRLDLDAASHPLYPDTPQTLAAIRALGVKIALVSNIHYDLRADVTRPRRRERISGLGRLEARGGEGRRRVIDEPS